MPPTADPPTAAPELAPELAPVAGVFDLAQVQYTQYYCEENIYCMVRDHVAPELRGDFYVVFISNVDKCVALNFQKVCTTLGIPAYWDYHVILLHHPRAHPHTLTVYDLDTALPFGLPWRTYLTYTLSPGADHPPPHSPPRLFKVVPAPEYLRLFASTRAHMRREVVAPDGARAWAWIAPPPPWDAIVSDEGTDTLARFLDFGHGGDRFGRVYGEGEFLAFLEGLVGG